MIMTNIGGMKLGWMALLGCVCVSGVIAQDRPAGRATTVSIVNGRWHLNGTVTYPGTPAEGLLMNVRMVNAVFEDRKRPDFDAEANADEFIRQIPDYVSHGVRAFSLCLQGGMPGYEGAENSAFNPEGTLRDGYLARVRRVIEACDRHGAAVILGCYYQRQDQVLKDDAALRAGVVNVARWVTASGFTNVTLEIANEFGHRGFDHQILKTPAGVAGLVTLAKQTAPRVLVSASSGGDSRLPDDVIRASDYLLIHLNNRRLDDKTIPERLAALKKHGKPVVCNEDAKVGADGAKIAELCIGQGVSWGYMSEKVNQHFPFTFRGAADDPPVYAAIKRLTTPTAVPSPPANTDLAPGE